MESRVLNWFFTILLKFLNTQKFHSSDKSRPVECFSTFFLVGDRTFFLKTYYEFRLKCWNNFLLGKQLFCQTIRWFIISWNKRDKYRCCIFIILKYNVEKKKNSRSNKRYRKIKTIQRLKIVVLEKSFNEQY